MPCQHDADPRAEARELRASLDSLTNLLCQQCRFLETQQDFGLLFIRPVRDWWQAHKAKEEFET